MDRSRDVRRGGASRFSTAKRQIIKQSGVDGNGGEAVFSEKLKKERMRRLSVVGRASASKEDGEMGCRAGSDGEEDELLRPATSISKRFKLPRKFFHECNRVDHASVPRKLRSAMKKRNSESISPLLPDKKKPNHGINGVELPRKDGKMKSIVNQKGELEGSPSQPIVGRITKDEEEAVETLYALAVMFPNSNKKNGLDDELAKEKCSPLTEGGSSKLAFEDSAAPEKEEDPMSRCSSTTALAANLSLLEGSAQETVAVKCSNEPSLPGFPRSTQLHTKLDNTISQRNVQAMFLLSKSKPIYGKPSCSSVSCIVQSELSLGTGSKQSKRDEAAACVRKPEIAVVPAAAFSSQHELQRTIKESKTSGSGLWPGLSSAGSHCAGTRGPSFKPPTTKSPDWLGMAASATQPGLLDNGALTEKDSRARVATKKSWNRCSAHVYISRLIKVLQIAEKTDRSATQPAQLTPNEGSKQGLLAANSLNGVSNCLNGVVAAHSTVGSATENNPNEVRNAILLHKRLLQDQQQASTSSVLYTSQKESFDFLSLSAGGGGLEATNSTNKAGNGLEPLTQLHIPYLQSLAQNQTIMPFSLPQNRFSSTCFTEHLSVAAAKQVQIQLPPYLGSPLLGHPHFGNNALPNQQQQQQQHQRIWTAQLAAQYKPMELAESHIPNWQNGRPDPYSAIQPAQSIPRLSRSSPGVLGPKYVPISQQQQPIAVDPFLATARAKRHHHHLPSGYEGNGVGSYPDTAPPLQLLCNKQL